MNFHSKTKIWLKWNYNPSNVEKYINKKWKIKNVKNFLIIYKKDSESINQI